MTSIYVPFYHEWMEVIEDLSDEDYGRLVRAIFNFARGKTKRVARLSPQARVAYSLITSAITRSEGKRREKEKSMATASQGGNVPKVFRRIERYSDTADEKNEENRRESPTERTFSHEKEDKSPTKEKFTPPSKDEVRNFFKKQGFESNPDEFFNFYESNGWKVGQNPMENWYASAENFEIKHKKAASVEKQCENKQDEHKLMHIDANEAFRLALERSARWDDDDD